QQLGAVIAARAACLVILDNFEQVARHAEETLGRWLEAAPQASFIATSREVLGIVGERALVLAPLAGDEAVRMFRQRVQAAGVDERPSDQDEASVAALVDLLDRLPLAIELAAARARVMPPQMLLQRMGERFRLLTSRGGRRDRQATLRATLDWSWELLAPAEQSALAQLSVFEGGFTLVAAEAVVDLGDFPGAPWVGDVVQTLLEKSLVRRLDGQRFDLLRSVQDYAGEKLAGSGAGGTVAAAAQQAAWQRHWRFFAGLDEPQARADRCAETDNLVLACRRAALAGAADAGRALLNAWAALCLTGPFATGVDLAQAVAATAPPASPRRAAAERVLGHALHLLGDAVRAREHCESGLALAQALGERVLQVQLRCLIANLDLGRGRPVPALQMLESALAVARECGDGPAQFLALNGLGRLHLGQSRLAAAQQCYLQALVLAEALQDRRWQGGLQGNLGHIAHAQGRLAEARDHYARGLALAREVGDRQWAGNAHCNLGLVLHELGESVAARTELDAALALARSVGHKRLEAMTLTNLGLVAEALSDDRAALSHHAEAAAAARTLGDLPLEGQLRGYLGLALARLGRAGEAQQELQSAESLLADCGDPLGFGLLLCQRAMACALSGEATAGRDLLERARALLAPLGLAENAEASQALAAARRLLAA
ncbi:MAG: tetratricopeptide repeat protein, partial [Burkholderiaceae bacterium]|nr:tetratricopeptide repeat protein [Burkholderiaceae bacterium]